MINIKLTQEHYSNPLPIKMARLIKKHTNTDDWKEAAAVADIAYTTLTAVLHRQRSLTHSNGVAVRTLLQLAHAKAMMDIEHIESL